MDDVLHKLTQVENSLINSEDVEVVFSIIDQIKRNRFMNRIQFMLCDKDNVQRIKSAFCNFDFEFKIISKGEKQTCCVVCWK